MKVKIDSIDHLGTGITKVDNLITFVPKSVPNDICDITIIKKHTKYNIAKIDKIIAQSPQRIPAICPYYDVCGGCQISNLTYQEQLQFKKNKIINIFQKYLKLNISPEIVPSDNIYNYRNKITFKIFNNHLSLVDIFNRPINIKKCLLVSQKVNDLCDYIEREDLSKVRKIIIKECDNGLILNISGTMNINNLTKFCLSIYNDKKCLYYKEDGYITLNDIKYRLSNLSFFQINTQNITKLYDLIVKYGQFSKKDNVIDLYCGVGSISLYISKYINKVLGIEIIPDAIEDAKYNAKINNINNATFLCGDVAKLINNHKDYDTIIVDPPRIGLDNYTIDILNNVKSSKIIYVSCDPMTLVRDLKKLTNYNLEDITLVDMFPQTHHVECVSLLQRKSSEK